MREQQLDRLPIGADRWQQADVPQRAAQIMIDPRRKCLAQLAGFDGDRRVENLFVVPAIAPWPLAEATGEDEAPVRLLGNLPARIDAINFVIGTI